jgi:hypothetical protein
MICPARPDGRRGVRRCAGGDFIAHSLADCHETIRRLIAVLFVTGFDTARVASVVPAGNVMSHPL